MKSTIWKTKNRGNLTMSFPRKIVFQGCHRINVTFGKEDINKHFGNSTHRFLHPSIPTGGVKSEVVVDKGGRHRLVGKTCRVMDKEGVLVGYPVKSGLELPLLGMLASRFVSKAARHNC